MLKTQISSTTSRQKAIVATDLPKKAVGKKIARVEQELAHLDKFENQVKNGMQDRHKFMSGKNARCKDKELDALCKKQEELRVTLRTLQELA